MGYTTEFEGSIRVEPPLSAEEVSYLVKFSDTRRMNRRNGPYYVEDDAWNSKDIINSNSPPDGQPGLWCQWIPTEDGEAIEWNGSEKFYDSAQWMKYLIEHFIGSEPKARKELDFLTGHVCNGEIRAQGEDPNDRWKLIVKDNKVFKAEAIVTFGPPREIRDDD